MNKPISVAIVDDKAVARNSLCMMLECMGFRVLTQAVNGRTFLEQLEAAPELPAVCILDIQMPVMNGFDTALALKRVYPSIKIIGYSFGADQWVIDKIMRCGADLFVAKGDTKGLVAGIRDLGASATKD